MASTLIKAGVDYVETTELKIPSAVRTTGGTGVYNVGDATIGVHTFNGGGVQTATIQTTAVKVTVAGVYPTSPAAQGEMIFTSPMAATCANSGVGVPQNGSFTLLSAGDGPVCWWVIN